jgi:hypothetical protein
VTEMSPEDTSCIGGWVARQAPRQTFEHTFYEGMRVEQVFEEARPYCSMVWGGGGGGGVVSVLYLLGLLS